MSSYTWQEIIDAATSNTDQRLEQGAAIEVFSTAFGLACYGWSESFEQDMRKVWVVSWTCTDTQVGIAVYLLHKEPVAVSVQLCRKCKEDLYFIAKETERKVFDRVIKELWNERELVTLLNLTDFVPAWPNEDQQQFYRSLLKEVI